MFVVKVIWAQKWKRWWLCVDFDLWPTLKLNKADNKNVDWVIYGLIQEHASQQKEQYADVHLYSLNSRDMTSSLVDKYTHSWVI